MLRVYNYIRPRGVTMLGPNCPGALSPGKANVGIIPAEIFSEGSIGLVSRSGTLTYQIGHELTGLGLGNSTIVGIGGDPIVGSSFIDILGKFEADPETEIVVMVGEIGGDEEEKAARYIAESDEQAGRRLHRRLQRAAREDDGARRRDHHRLVRNRGGEEGGARGGRGARRHVTDRGRADRGRGRARRLSDRASNRRTIGTVASPEHRLASPAGERGSSPPGWGYCVCMSPVTRSLDWLDVDTIAFTRGVPTPEPAGRRRSPTARAPRSSATGRRSSTTGRSRATGRCASGSRSGTASIPAQVFITNGSLQGLSLLAGLLVDPGARVLVEAPTYDRALHIIARHRGEPVPTPMDEEGLDPDALELDAAAFLYTIPTFQNPSGRTLTLERRQRLAELAREGAC